MSRPAAPAPAGSTRPDASMSLLVDVANDSLDRAYAEAADRRSARRTATAGRGAEGHLDGSADGSADTVRAGGGHDRTGGWPALLALLVVGLVVGTAGGQLHARRSSDEGARARLLADVRRGTAASDALARSAQALRRDVSARRDSALGDGASGRARADRLAELELATGQTAVSGPGLVVTMDDAPTAGEQAAQRRGGETGGGRVLDRDLQDLVNGLWAAGAEAVTVNDLRLTALTAIRSAGEAVLVDFRPLSPPYVVRAIGDPATFAAAFRRGPAARRLSTYPALYGVVYGVRPSARVDLPGAAAPDLRLARPVGSGS